MSEKPDVSKIKSIIERIKNINNKIITKSLEEKEDYFFKNHYDIMGNYPFLVSQICSGGNLDELEYMISSLEQVEKGNSSKEEMDKIVGERLSEQFVKPLDKNPDNSENDDTN